MKTTTIAAAIVLGAAPFIVEALGRHTYALVQKEVVTYTVDYVQPPSTVAGLWDHSNAVVRGKVLARKAEAAQKPGADIGTARVSTLLTIELSEVLKPNEHIPLNASTIDIVQAAGELDIGTKVVRVDGGYDPLVPESEYILFLEWNQGLQHFEIAYGPDGTFLLRNGLIETPARNDPGRRLQKTPVASFLQVIRALQ
jgi:hypothetical protein